MSIWINRFQANSTRTTTIAAQLVNTDPLYKLLQCSILLILLSLNGILKCQQSQYAAASLGLSRLCYPKLCFHVLAKALQLLGHFNKFPLVRSWHMRYCCGSLVCHSYCCGNPV